MFKSAPQEAPVKLLEKAAASGNSSEVQAWLRQNQLSPHFVVTALNENTQDSIYKILFNGLNLKPFEDGQYGNEVFATFRESLLKRKSHIAFALLRHFPDLAPSWGFIRDTQSKENVLHLAAGNGFPEVLDLLLELIDTRTPDRSEREKILSAENDLGHTVLELSARAGDLKSFKKLAERQPTLLEGCSNRFKDTPLHDVVRARTDVHFDDDRLNGPAEANIGDIWDELIEFIVERKPESLCARNKDDHSPYTLALELRDIAVRTKNRKQEEYLGDMISALKDHIYRKLCNRISSIREALYGGKGKQKELHIDLSDFDNQSTHNFQNFIRYLDAFTAHGDKEYDERKQEGEAQEYTDPDADGVSVPQIIFEDTLSYVLLPNFASSPECPFQTMILPFLKLLRKRNVHKIFTLIVLDSLSNPTSEAEITEVLNMFEIECLNWQKLDMDLEVFKGNQRFKQLRELYLYSSGNWALLYYWGMDDVLHKDNQLKLIDITIACPEQPSISLQSLGKKAIPKRGNSQRQRLEGYKERLKKMLETNHLTGSPAKFKSQIDVRDMWRPNPPHGDSLNEDCFQFFRDLSRAHDICSEVDQHNRAAWEYEPVKVAVIDSGVDWLSEHLRECLQYGVSYAVDATTGKELPWWHVYDAHGTQMASLIQKVNPYCQIYPVRAGRTRAGMNPEQAARAIGWAIKEGVDIISMSWTGYQKHPSLTKAIGEASSENILMFCSTSDDSRREDSTWNGEGRVFTVAAADKYGHWRPQSDQKASLLLPGDSIMASGPRYMSSPFESAVSGSSVATALAAGLASLAISCTIAQDREIARKLFRQKGEMEKVFRKMREREDSKYIVPLNLLRAIEEVRRDSNNARQPYI